MCMGNLADQTMKVVGTAMDPFDTFGIQDKAREAGEATKSTISTFTGGASVQAPASYAPLQQTENVVARK